jgi:hypothetical protein
MSVPPLDLSGLVPKTTTIKPPIVADLHPATVNAALDSDDDADLVDVCALYPTFAAFFFFFVLFHNHFVC